MVNLVVVYPRIRMTTRTSNEIERTRASENKCGANNFPTGLVLPDHKVLLGWVLFKRNTTSKKKMFAHTRIFIKSFAFWQYFIKIFTLICNTVFIELFMREYIEFENFSLDFMLVFT